VATTSASGAGPAFQRTETLTRSNVVDGKSNVVVTNTVTVSVSQTSNVKNRQELAVTWSGAHPTGGTVSDPNSATGALQEYPVVLMECRGTDTPTTPASQQINPADCWTQTADERVLGDSFPYPAWRLDEYATAAQRALDVGIPKSLPRGCALQPAANYWLPFVSVSGTTYAGGPKSCAGAPPEMSQNGSTEANIPGNTTYAVTKSNGTGSANFVIQTAEANASMGCSQTVACSLVIVPIEGLSCDPQAASLPASDQPPALLEPLAAANCEATGVYAPGDTAPANPVYNPRDVAVTGSLWFMPSNWRNRIDVPLTFAPPGNYCSSVNTGSPLLAYGSELATQALGQWEPHFCTNSKLFDYNLVQSAEPEAKTLLQAGSIEAAVEAEPPSTPFSTPTVQAPIALSGFAVTYDYGNQLGAGCTQMDLDPRLLAKMLTESYQADNTIGEPGLAGNPVDIARDPEFQALNPNCQPGGLYNTQPDAVLFTVTGGSDVINALTSYINADPEARGWLNGTPDPWGMKVNPAYKSIKLPVSLWPLLDDFNGSDKSAFGGQSPEYNDSTNPCLAAEPNAPIMPLIAAPQPGMQNVTTNMQFDIAASKLSCSGPPANVFGPLGRQDPDNVLMFGVTSLADAAEYNLSTAALETSVSSDSSGAKITSGAGRTFALPSDGSIKAATSMLTPDQQTGSWALPYKDFFTTSSATSQQAYPGTTLLSLDVPTKGLPAKQATDYSELLSYADGPGQTPGTSFGQLPAGYVPMTTADGMSGLVQYTEAAAVDVAAQSGSVPSVIAVNAPPGSESNSTTGAGGAGTLTQSGNASSGGSGLGNSGATSGLSSASGGQTPGSTASVPSTGSTGRSPRNIVVEPASAVGKTSFLGVGLGGLALPIAALVALVGAGAAGYSWWRTRRRGATS
jgi:hypothetical protein